MQTLLFQGPHLDLKDIWARLARASGRRDEVERPDPVSQFVGAFIASRTSDGVSLQAFWRLLEAFPSWDDLADAPVSAIEAAIFEVSYAADKAPNLRQALRMIRARAGAIDLEFLADHPVERALNWLEEIHGVGRKIAAESLNFSTLRKRCFVVDTHVLRILRRFGFVGPKADGRAAYDAVMSAAGALTGDDLYTLHWDLKKLGQSLCRPSHALCDTCPLADLCLKALEPGVLTA